MGGAHQQKRDGEGGGRKGKGGGNDGGVMRTMVRMQWKTEGGDFDQPIFFQSRRRSRGRGRGGREGGEGALVGAQ